MSSNCKSCGARITWAFTPNGKRMPVDADPSADGNVMLHWETNQGGGRDAFAVVLAADDAKAHRGTLYSSHFRTCPNAATHRTHRTLKRLGGG